MAPADGGPLEAGQKDIAERERTVGHTAGKDGQKKV